MYPEDVVMPMKAQLTQKGFIDLDTSEKVTEALNKPGTTLLIINSVCGCAAGSARPGVILSIEGAGKKPEFLTTTFAGFDIEAVKTAREHLVPFPPSSPSIALFKDGELVHFLERHHIEGHSAEMIAENLQQAYEEFC
ncbi:BrxA/BrxB family bacilliredoxin [Apibacter adventoris]|uniref:BrxA/BrxB family bacilliredoxin n=1 Tax=Apibacter adventoris TaxID=1679466 RepID=A0A2S8AFN2_9FLAO|nr:BrxA/BrxB family bacilliredoxin [Apibacter adventoris]PQL95035.1 BrxA/BrxB family bacilliredoxin [Apibacter adventoris]